MYLSRDRPSPSTTDHPGCHGCPVSLMIGRHVHAHKPARRTTRWPLGLGCPRSSESWDSRFRPYDDQPGKAGRQVSFGVIGSESVPLDVDEHQASGTESRPLSAIMLPSLG